MKKEVETILNSIGWEKVRFHYPLTTRKVYQALSPKTCRQHAREQFKDLQGLKASISETAAHLEALDPTVRGLIDFGAAPTGQREIENWSKLEEILDTLRDLDPVFDMAEEVLEHDSRFHEKGRPKLEQAHEIASAFAEVYCLGLEKKPGSGVRSDHIDGPSGPYCNALENVFHILGIAVSDIRNIADAALDDYTVDSLENLKNKNRMASAKGDRFGLSIFDLVLLGKSSPEK